MMPTFRIVKVDSKYCDYLRTFDERVSYNSGSKELRPFIGVLFEVKGLKYFAPLSSPKPKHKTMRNKEDFIKIDNGELGAVNFNNMIPVSDKNYKDVDISSQNSKYQHLLKSQLMWLNRNVSLVQGKAIKLYNKYVSKKLPSYVFNLCCNFPLLEEKCKEYNEKQ